MAASKERRNKGKGVESVKDWDYYRAKFLTERIDGLYKVLNTLEECTPIERIAALECVKFRDLLGEVYVRINLQEEVGPYRADITVYHNELDLKVAVECDGHDFHEKTKDQAAKDKKRDREFQKLGYVILRYTGSEIVNNPSAIKKDLMNLALTAMGKKIKAEEAGVGKS